jgi:DnaK suppressor protein
MDSSTLNRYRQSLQAMVRRTSSSVESLTDSMHDGSGGQAGGELSNVPTHLGDSGSTENLHELNATLLENESYLTNEVYEALERIDNGSYGTCGVCGQKIERERLDAIPYASLCKVCAHAADAGADVNLNHGRPTKAEHLNANTLTQGADVESSNSDTSADQTPREHRLTHGDDLEARERNLAEHVERSF